MRTPRAEFEGKIGRLVEIVRMSGGISTRTLAKALGESVSNTKKLIKFARFDGRIDFSEEREQREVPRGPAPYLLKAKP